MDAGVLRQQVFPHEATQHPALVVANGARIVPTLTTDSPVEKTEAVSLIIPTYFNRSLKRRALRHQLAGIERSRVIEEVVLVVASGTDDGEASLAAPLTGKRLIFANCEPNRRSRSRNAGVAAATRDILLFLDDDMLLQDWRVIDVFVSVMLSGRFDCALFPRRNYAKFPLLYRDADLDRFIRRWRSEGDRLDDPDFIDPICHGAPYKTMTFCFPGCFMLIRREAYERIGGFPPEYEGWGFEDAAVAMRAVRSLKVLNLFRKSHPLLHIDHPVSPYKTEEYRTNLRRFNASHGALDMDWLCRRIFSGDDFSGQENGSLDVSAYYEPLKGIADVYHLPSVEHELAKSYRMIIQNRLEMGCDPMPVHVILHGSRGKGTSTAGSDYDLLVLYRNGAAPEYFIGQAEGSPRLEIEFSDFGKFEAIATAPVYHSLFGPLELAKIAQGIRLWGDADIWDRWSGWLLRTALQVGRTYWLLYALGTGLSPEKVGVLRERFIKALGVVLERADPDRAGEVLGILAEGRLEPLAAYVRQSLNVEMPGWREETLEGKRIFALQVPEVWAALRFILERR
jgi:glycosyltransferase involved in cell wall biosynthesis